MPTGNDYRYVVIGAGAIGGCLGGVLARAGVRVVLVARGRNAEALAADGLTLRTPDGTFRAPIQTVSSPEDLRLTDRDVLVFATKTQQLDAALEQWVDHPVHLPDGTVTTAGERLPVLTALNGVVAEEKALRYFARVFGVCVWCPAVHLDPGEVIVRSWPVVGQFHIARWPASIHTAADGEFLAELAATWTAAGIGVRTPGDVAPWKYNKLLMNLGNAIDALARRDADVGQVVGAAIAEGSDVLRRAGIDFVPFETSDAVRSDGPHPRPVPGFEDAPNNSTSQSLSRNTGNVETDYLNGEIVRLAHRHGIAAPVNAALTRAARAASRDGQGTGQYSPEQLAELVGLDPVAAQRG
ncbi:ketopantoate reductase family protein [Mycolicibacterium palauense]|uniref:ketopantoate reductase family protein n=1 Tax=Mycolicibacterium palauense TaxID=2034511 RepID=UPI000BFEAB8A|nr:2-dehydropantoate 2-reductase N-terminal domain-containing protein [Mycolicibacterium palauense]